MKYTLIGMAFWLIASVPAHADLKSAFSNCLIPSSVDYRFTVQIPINGNYVLVLSDGAKKQIAQEVAKQSGFKSYFWESVACTTDTDLSGFFVKVYSRDLSQ